MSELEDKGYLFHPHTSAGRIPTDRAYRVYVERDHAPGAAQPGGAAHAAGRAARLAANAVEEILRRAAQVLGVLTQELGVAVAPALDEMVLERLELVPVSAERLLLVFNLRSGVVRTIFVEVPGGSAPEAVQRGGPDPERAAGRAHAAARSAPRCPSGSATPAARDGGRELLNIFIAEGEEIFDLADEPERGGAGQRADAGRAAGVRLQRADARAAPAHRGARPAASRRSQRAGRRGLSITIGAENPDARLTDFTLVTSSYEAGGLQGRHRRDGTDPDAVRQDHRAGGAHQPPGGRICWSERVLRAARRRRATRPRPTSRRPTASSPWSSIPTGIPRPRRRPSSRRSPRRTRSSAIRRSARPTIATARRASAARRRVRLPPRRSVRGAQHLHARLRRHGRLRVALRRRRGRRPTRAAARTSG